MKKFIFLIGLLLTTFSFSAQIVKPVKWTSRVENLGNNELRLVFEAAIDADWHVYSQYTPDGGPLPLEAIFKDEKGNYERIGKLTESQTRRQYNDIFEVDELFFENKATLTQKVRIVNPDFRNLNVTLQYQVCKEVCINDKASFEFAVPKMEIAAPKTAVAVEKSTGAETHETVATVADTVDGADVSIAPETAPPTTRASSAISPETTEDRSLWGIFIIAFLSGFAALLTPCVFPLIPMTVSFFTKTSKTRAAGVRNAITYGISIIVIYVVLGSLVTAIFGADALNALATDVWFNLIFFVLLVVFAVSFLGAFEIMLPNSWASKVDKQADRGGIVGILFMALALAIVSFSCTGPIVGTLLFEAASQGGIGPIVGMFGFSLALALPFMLFAMFPGWLNSLPRSGGWLNTVKVSLGFLELALAFKFLSNADLVLQLHLLERELFIAIWIAIFGTWTLYLFGKIRTPHDSDLPFLSVGRLLLGVLTLTFTIYLVPGLWGAPLKLISAFPPPMEYSESPLGVGGSAAAFEGELPKGAKRAHNMIVFMDYEDGLAYAKETGKPAMLDFTGYACVNCRKMENNVWTRPDVFEVLKNDLVIISLYVDDKRKLPENEQFISELTGEKIETTGDKWTDFMLSRYNTNTQPLYVLVDPDGNDISETTISYVGADEYLAWLRKGLNRFKTRK